MCAGTPASGEHFDLAVQGHQAFLRLGTLTDLKFLRVEADGWDAYEAIFENGKLLWKVGPLTPEGKLAGTWFEFP